MPVKRVDSPAEAVAFVRPDDTLTIGLGPAHPIGFLHALGERDDWTGLEMFGALLTDLYAVFTKPGVHFRSGSSATAAPTSSTSPPTSVVSHRSSRS